MKRLKIFKSRNVTYNPLTKEAYSYEWWCFVKVINGKLVFNNYCYSKCTSRHQSKVFQLVKPDIYIEAPQGLQDLSSALKHLYTQKIEIEMQLSRTNRKKKLDEQRQSEIGTLEEKITFLKQAKATIDNQTIKNLYEQALENELLRLLDIEASKPDLVYQMFEKKFG